MSKDVFKRMGYEQSIVEIKNNLRKGSGLRSESKVYLFPKEISLINRTLDLQAIKDIKDEIPFDKLKEYEAKYKEARKDFNKKLEAARKEGKEK